MPVDVREAIAALRRSHAELAAFVAGADAGALSARSGSSEWAVADVLSHLGSAAEIGFNTLTTGRADLDAAPAIWDRWNTMAPAEKASNFVIANERLVEAFESLDGAALADKKVDLGFLPAPVDVSFFAGMRLGEVGLHTWDIDVASDRNAVVHDYLVPFVLERLPMFAGFFAKPAGKTGVLAVDMTQPSRSYVLELRDDGASLEEASNPEAENRLTTSGEAFARLTAGRLDPAHTPSVVQIVGALSLDDLRLAFPGY
jgi:uncharacterized protein (TIGR03083 family)